MSNHRGERNELKVGIFALFSLSLGAFVLIVLSGLLSELTFPRKQYRAVFTLAHGVQSLVPSSKVRVGGMVMGVVNEITPVFDRDIGQIVVDFEVDRKVPIYENALVTITSPLFPGPAFLDLIDLGTGPIFASQETELMGRTEGTLAKFFGPKANEDINRILGSLEVVTGRFEGPQGILGGILGHEQADAVARGIRQLNENLESLGEIEKLLKTRLGGLMNSTERLLDESAPLVITLKETLVRLEAALEESQSLLIESRPEITATVRGLRKTFDELGTNIVPAISRAAKKIEQLAVKLDLSFSSIEHNAPKWSSDFSNVLANLDQLMMRSKSMVNDLSSSPWRLLYRPTNEELEYDRINQATWNLWHSVQELEGLIDALALAENDGNKKAQERLLIRLESQAVLVEEAQEVLERSMQLRFPDMMAPAINE